MMLTGSGVLQRGNRQFWKIPAVAIILIVAGSQYLYSAWIFGKINSITRRGPHKNDYGSRAGILVAIQSLAKKDKQKLLHDVLEDDPHIFVATNHHHATAKELRRKNHTNSISSTDYLISAFGTRRLD
jgi:hypothetical protein